jgi:monoamine oxidase
VAIPPHLAGRIDYSPKLPAMREQLTQRMPMGSVIKVQAVYPRPFWRDAGFNGQVVSDTGPVQVTFDNSPPDGSRGVLMGFVEASTARRLDGPGRTDERRRLVLENYAAYFGDEALGAIQYVEARWDDEVWTRGCPVCAAPPGVLLDYGPSIRTPAGRIHWAGTETSTYWNGYMDGAVRSGERAAREVLARLGKTVCARPGR